MKGEKTMPKYRKKPVVVEAFKLGCEEYPSWFYKKVLEHEIIAQIVVNQ